MRKISDCLSFSDFKTLTSCGHLDTAFEKCPGYILEKYNKNKSALKSCLPFLSIYYLFVSINEIILHHDIEWFIYCTMMVKRMTNAQCLIKWSKDDILICTALLVTCTRYGIHQLWSLVVKLPCGSLVNYSNGESLFCEYASTTAKHCAKKVHVS